MPKSRTSLVLVMMCCLLSIMLSLSSCKQEPPIAKVSIPTVSPMPDLYKGVPFEKEFRGMRFVINKQTPQGISIKFENKYRISLEHKTLFRLYVLTGETWKLLEFKNRPSPSDRSTLFRYKRLDFAEFYSVPLEPGTYRIVFEVWLRDGLFEGDKEKIKKGWFVDRAVYLYTDFEIS